MNRLSFRIWLGVWLALLFFGAMLWAKGRDPFERFWFIVKTAGFGKAECIAVLPRQTPRPLPVVIYLHGAGGDLLRDGNELRQMAEMGLAAVGLEYNQTNQAAFEAQFSALLLHLQKAQWADASATAWLGFSLGANRQLSFALKHPELRPRLLVRLSGGWVPELDGREHSTSNIEHPTPNEPNPSTLNPSSRRSHAEADQPSTILLLHGEQDGTFPIAEARRVAAALATNGLRVEINTFPGQPHTFEPDRGVLIRAIAERCLKHFKGDQALDQFVSIPAWQARAKPLWLFWTPALVWMVGWLWLRRRFTSAGINERTPLPSLSPADGERVAGRSGEGLATSLPRKLTRWEIGLRWLAGILAALAICLTLLHVVTPRLPISPRTLTMAKKLLVPPQDKADFEFLSAQPVWHGKPLRTLLQHVALANYTRGLTQWKLDDQTYRDFVLSPQIDPALDGAMDWRRTLWESFYPRVRRDDDPMAAAQMVVRFLRQRVGISPDYPYRLGVETIWTQGMTDEAGFERIYVAALRSVGIGARLSGNKQAELFADGKWQPAPRPFITTF